MKKIALMKYSVLMFCLLAGCSDSSNDSGLIEINTQKEYPVSDLKLSDVAEVKYIPLRLGKDSVYVVYPGTVCVVGETFFLKNSGMGGPPSQLIRYNMNGEVIGMIDRLGNGPQEYIKIEDYAVDSLAGEVFIWDMQLNSILVYDLSGQFKRSGKGGAKYYVFGEINTDYLMGYTPNNRWNKPPDMRVRDGNIPALSFIEKKSLEVIPTNFDYLKPRDMGSMMVINHFSFVPDGVYITCERSDTVYLVDRQRAISPRMVDVTPYSEKQAQVFPVIETDRYIFLSKEQELKREQPSLSKWKSFVYDKQKQQLFRLNVDMGRYKDLSLALANDQIALTQFNITRNSNYAMAVLIPKILDENPALLPPELQQIADSLKEEDNPVLMLIKFK